MPKSLPIFSSFSSGEVSPLLASRSDIDAYKNGCAVLKNMISTSHGPAYRRYGTEFIATYEQVIDGPPAPVDGRVFDFSISKSYGAFVTVQLDEYGDTQVIPYAPNGIIFPPAIELITNHLFEENSTGWTVAAPAEGKVTFKDGNCTLLPRDGDVNNYAGIIQQVSGTVNGNNLRLYIDCLDNDDDLTVRVGTTSYGADILDLDTKSKVIDVTFENTGTTSVWLLVYCKAGKSSRTIESISMYDASINIPSDRVTFSAPWTPADLPYIQADSPPEGDSIYFASPFTPPQKLTYNAETEAWTFAAVSFTGTPTEWVAGNYPRAITFFQGRMWLGGTPDQPETFWASKSAAIENFTQGAAADDGLEFTLSEQGEVEWITGAKNLIVGTANGEHIVESSGGVIVPSDIQITQQSSYGSRAIQAEKIGQKVMYVSPDGRKVREIGYQWTDDGWLSRDITFASEHITEENNIKQVAFAQNPDNLLWCVTDQGELVCGTYEKTYNVIGWHQHDTVGRFLDVASVDINGSSILGLLVEREVNGQLRVMFEIIDPAESAHQDCWKYFYSDTPVVEITGLDHLAGNTVDVLTDTGVHPPVTVTSAGIAPLQWDTQQAIIGYNFISNLTTLSPDMIGNEGSTHSMEKGWNRVIVRLLNSAKPLINGDRPAERFPNTPMNEPESLRIEDVEVMDLGYESWSRIEIVQDLPLPMTVLGVFGEQERSNL